MKKIVLNVNEEHLETVMTVLTNLKAGLIESIEGEGVKHARKTSYVPKEGKMIDQSEKPMGKYASPALYKSRLNKG